MTERTLIFGSSYVASPERAWLVQRWAGLILKLNPNTDVLIIDTPVEPSFFPALPRGIGVHRFDDNVGHLDRGGADGAGRAWCEGAKVAIAGDYTSIGFIETDLLLAWPVAPLIQRMRAAGKKFAQTKGSTYDWYESGIWLADVAWLRETRFADVYKWDYVWDRAAWPGLMPEHRLAEMTSAVSLDLRLPGCRDEHNTVNKENVGDLAWLTHSTPELYEALLRAHGHGDLLDDK